MITNYVILDEVTGKPLPRVNTNALSADDLAELWLRPALDSEGYFNFVFVDLDGVIFEHKQVEGKEQRVLWRANLHRLVRTCFETKQHVVLISDAFAGVHSLPDLSLLLGEEMIWLFQSGNTCWARRQDNNVYDLGARLTFMLYWGIKVTEFFRTHPRWSSAFRGLRCNAVIDDTARHYAFFTFSDERQREITGGLAELGLSLLNTIRDRLVFCGSNTGYTQEVDNNVRALLGFDAIPTKKVGPLFPENDNEL